MACTSVYIFPTQAFTQDATSFSILVLGDSLSAEYGLPRYSGWVHLLQNRLSESDSSIKVINSSVSGDTTSAGKSRIDVLLERYKPQIVVVELGSNDALRGLPLKMSQENLTYIIRKCQQAGSRVLIAGMEIPPNYGKEYADQFKYMFTQLSQIHQTALIPFLMDGFGDKRELFQADGIHPNASAQPIMMETVLKALLPLIKASQHPGHPG